MICQCGEQYQPNNKISVKYVGLCPDCRKEARNKTRLEGYSKKYFEKHPVIFKACTQCGDEFTVRRKDCKFPSLCQHCRMRIYGQLDNIKKFAPKASQTCDYCGEIYIGYVGRKIKACSEKCYHRAYYQAYKDIFWKKANQ